MTWRNKRLFLCKEKLDLLGMQRADSKVQIAVAKLLDSTLKGSQCLEI